MIDENGGPLIWEEARSARSVFLQMCIRDSHVRCHELWDKLGERDREEFDRVDNIGPPSQDFFYDLLVHDRETDASDSNSDAKSDTSLTTTTTTTTSADSEEEEQDSDSASDEEEDP